MEIPSFYTAVISEWPYNGFPLHAPCLPPPTMAASTIPRALMGFTEAKQYYIVFELVEMDSWNSLYPS